MLNVSDGAEGKVLEGENLREKVGACGGGEEMERGEKDKGSVGGEKLERGEKDKEPVVDDVVGVDGAAATQYEGRK